MPGVCPHPQLVRTRSAFRAYDVPELRNEQGTLGFRLIKVDRPSKTKKIISEHGTEHLNFVTILDGTYQIGSPHSETGHQTDEKLHTVK